MGECLRDYIHHDLKEAILYRGLAQGTILREKDILQKYVVSRTPARQALELLEQEGLLVRCTEASGWRVQIIAYEELEELVLLYIGLEKILSRRAVLYVTDGHIQELYNIEQQIKSAVSSHNIQYAANLCQAWQRDFFGVSKAKKTLMLYDTLPSMTNFSWLWNGIDTEKHLASILENTSMIEAAARRDAVEFHRLYQAHMMDYLNWCQEAYQNMQL